MAASVSHIRDPPKNQLGVDRADNYKRSYVISDDRQSVGSKLHALVAQAGADRVYLAIALELDSRAARRVSLKEITAETVTGAISNHRTIDTRLTAAQETRLSCPA